MPKKKNRGNSLSTIRTRIILFTVFAAAVYGAYVYLKQENRLPHYIEQPIENALNETAQQSGKIKEKLLNTVETLTSQEKKTQDKTPETPEKKSLNLKLEIPISGINRDEIILKRFAYTLSYNKKMKNPNWVAWELTRKETYGKEERNDKFVPDPDLPEPRAKSGDYTHTGYDRGHMAPAADMKWNSKAMDESFYMSNICPQNKKLNRGDWNDLEDACRNWAKKYGTIYIACGPIYDQKNPKRIGTNKIAVPDRFFKVVLIYNRKDPMALGFIFPNKAHSQDLNLYQVSVDSIEDVTGYDFFAKLPDSIENRIEAELRSLPSSK